MYEKIKSSREVSFRAAGIVAIFFMVTMLMYPVGQVAAEKNDPKNIVFVDIGKIIEVHPAFLKAQEEFGTEIQGMQEELQGMAEEEQMMAQQQMQQQMQQRGEQLQEEALKEMKKDLQKIADEKGYDYIFDANSLIVGGRDVTDEILEALK
ncbi:OmpH family outer membrane protein [Desulfopila inferna]|uniref:OmpH family outer membrane protein n=1 Tax=Desulfopila inferna TaxID=468528 RepID=UPI001964B580|nr:OmpH family outer membrane protein [Desulfopila inferna]MBM9605578.1 OmpH family outer membrane protein [Desulfopila inferna]